MSRHCLATYVISALVVLCTGLLGTPVATAQTNKPAKASIHDVLAMELETKDYQKAMVLKDFLNRLHKSFAGKGVELPIFVDVEAFKVADESQPNGPYDDEVRLPAAPMRMTTAQALQFVIGQIKSDNGAFFVRNGTIVITTQEDAGLSARLQVPVVARFNKTPFSQVVRQFVDTTGAAIMIDPRLHEKAQAPITAELNGNVSLAAVLPAIADMADLRVVRISVATGPRRARAAAARAQTQTVTVRSFSEGPIEDATGLDECLYITTAANAEAMEKRLRERSNLNGRGLGGSGGTVPMPATQPPPAPAASQPPASGRATAEAANLAQIQAQIAALRAEVARLRQLKTEPKTGPNGPVGKQKAGPHRDPR